MFDRPVLGIDPGVSRCGFGALARDGARLTVERCGVLRTDPREVLARRLAELEADLETLVADVRPGAVVVERVLFQANARTAMSVGQASGLALAVAARAGVEVVQYSPNEVKLAVTGDGRADKQQVQTMVARVLHLAEPPRPPDVADALALAVCHVWRDRLGHAVTAASDGEPASGSRLQARIDAALARAEAPR